MQTNAITKVDKSQLLNRNFNKKPELTVHVDRKNIDHKLQRALKLGNLHKTSVNLRFISDRELLQTEATIWAVTENYVMLKGGVMIPVECIIDVDV